MSSLTTAPARTEAGTSLRLIGLLRRYTYAGRGGIAGQWADFAPSIAAVAGRSADAAYGLCSGFDGLGFDYLCAVGAAPDAGVPAGLCAVMVPALRWAVFTHDGHVSAIADTCRNIQIAWPGLGLGTRPAAALLLERYGPAFNPVTGRGDIEVWLPVADDASKP